MVSFLNETTMLWIDAETHLLPQKRCHAGYRPPDSEDVMIRIIYDHPEGPLALSRANTQALLEEMDRAGIDRAVVMGLPWRSPDLCWENNDYIADAVSRFPDRLIGVGVLPDPRRVCPVDSVRRIRKQYGFIGVKVIPSWHGYRLDDELMEPCYDTMQELSLVLVPHTDHLFVDPSVADTPYSLLQVAQAYPELKILAPHLGGLVCMYGLHQPIRPILKNILFLASVPTTIKMVAFAIEAVGPKGVAFATDFPFNPSHDQYTVQRDLESLKLSSYELECVAGGNLQSFLRLDR